MGLFFTFILLNESESNVISKKVLWYISFKHLYQIFFVLLVKWMIWTYWRSREKNRAHVRKWKSENALISGPINLNLRCLFLLSFLASIIATLRNHDQYYAILFYFFSLWFVSFFQSKCQMFILFLLIRSYQFLYSIIWMYDWIFIIHLSDSWIMAPHSYIYFEEISGNDQNIAKITNN